jgi:hypothetical protein
MSVTEKPWGKIVHTDAGDIPIVRDRRGYVKDEDFSLGPDSLVGSWFHVVVAGEMVWQGVVVAEPQAGRYLCSIDQLDQHVGTKNVQRVFDLNTILGLGDEARRLLEGAVNSATAPVIDPSLEWRLYDNEEDARRAWSEYTAMRATNIESEVAE